MIADEVTSLVLPNSPHLPIVITLNPRKKIEAAQIPVKELKIKKEEGKHHGHHKIQLVRYPVTPPPKPVPKFPLNISWHPNTLCFKLEDEPVLIRVWIWNRSKRSIYFNCCGLWDDLARFGASWRCFPRTRIWLPPGLRSKLFVEATPHDASTIPGAVTYMQIAAGHLRDNVTGYFSIPIVAKFLKYNKPLLPEGE
ncbi:uncharacterized protein LOC124632503 [Helicoverpa zea]|uniref:uncharacterized protein LOC124632503 n=1 Tax=Helicoverpa zea TaxID=7113 RepID=UPI001F570470|nr:uncharacterized protein LOC124632503 [Helicoverpa zea]